MFVNVKDSKYVRDTNSMALINNDSSAREDYLMKSKILKSQKEEINNIRIEVSSIKNDMDEIKKLLVQLLGKGTNG
jgi:hypothetical protein